MYKTIYISDASQFGGIEDQLNDAAESGYRLVDTVQLTNRILLILEQRAAKGRPKKETTEAELGE